MIFGEVYLCEMKEMRLKICSTTSGFRHERNIYLALHFLNKTNLELLSKTKVSKGLLTYNSQTTELPFIFTAIHCDLHSPFTPKKSGHLLIHLSLTITQETHCNFLI